MPTPPSERQAFSGDEVIVGEACMAFKENEVRFLPVGTRVTFLRATQALIRLSDGEELEVRSSNLRIDKE